jgi:hypothetical protein
MSAVNVESGRSTGGGGGPSGGASGADDGMNDLYKVNQIYYRMMPTLSLVSKRTLLVNQAQSPSYLGTNSAVIFNFNTGEYYISPTTSYLFIQCGFNNPTTGGTGYGASKALLSQGNILSIIEEVIFTTASGTEVERQINKGLHHAITYRYGHTQEYIDTIGQIQGAPYGPYFRNHDSVMAVQTTTLASQTTRSAGAMYPALGGSDGVSLPRSGAAAKVHFGVGCHDLNVHSTSVNLLGAPTPQLPALPYPSFVVPLDQVLGVFKPYMNCLFPAGALSGGRLEFRFKRASEAFQFVGSMSELNAAGADADLGRLVGGADGAFTIFRTYLVLDAFQLQDNVLKKLNTTSAGADGLSMLFDTYDHVITPFAGVGSVETQVSQARSRVVRSWNAVRDNSSINNPYINSFATEAASRRVSAKVGPSSLLTTLMGTLPAITNSDVVIGGGYIVPTLLAAPADLKTIFTGVAPTFNWLIQQPRLPNDPYGADGTFGNAVVSSFQTQLGALFFPQQPITTVREHYQNALYMFGKGIPDKDMTCSVTEEDFKGGMGYHVYDVNGALVNPTILVDGTPAVPNNTVGGWVAPYGLAVYGALMEKSQALQLSGLPISNARLLRHKFTFAFLSLSSSRSISTFTQFTRVLKTFLGGRVVVRE